MGLFGTQPQVFDCLQYVDMKGRPGRSGNVWIILGRQQTILKPFLVIYPSMGWKPERCMAASIPFIVCNARDESTISLIGNHVPPCVYYTLCHCTRPGHQIIRG